MTDAQRAKLSESLMGRTVWNKGVKTGPNPNHSLRMKGRTPWNKGVIIGAMSEAHKNKIRQAHIRSGLRPPSPKGKPKSKETIAKIVSKTRGRKRPHCSGENSGTWKGGITPENAKIRTSIEYKNWRRSVFERDNYTCQWCGERGGNKQADHIKPFCTHPELRFDVSNGRTLCIPCHRKTPTFGARSRWLN